MTEYEVHGVGYSDTTEEDWDDPQLNDFQTEDLGEVADHILLSSSGFPPESFSDLRIPVVDPEGTSTGTPCRPPTAADTASRGSTT